MPEELNGKTCSFDVCSQCKIICCQDAKPPLTLKRKKIIKEYLKKQKIEIKQPFSREKYSYPVDKQILCVFFDKTTMKCVIHPVKPETCRSGPVTFDVNFATRKIEFFLKKSEICALAKILYENPTAFKAHFEVAKGEITQLVRELDTEDLKEVLKIEEPQTFKFCEVDLPKEVAEKLGLK